MTKVLLKVLLFQVDRQTIWIQDSDPSRQQVRNGSPKNSST
ncbi:MULTISPECIES: hypothetical protein [unclassified Synechococcus]|nr:MULTISPECIES: hypothetical protein [unclassified Synechococcus]